MLSKSRAYIQCGGGEVRGWLRSTQAPTHKLSLGSGGLRLTLEGEPEGGSIERTEEPAPRARSGTDHVLSDLERVLGGEDLSSTWPGDIEKHGLATLGVIYKSDERTVAAQGLKRRKVAVYKLLCLDTGGSKDAKVGRLLSQMTTSLESKTGGCLFFVGGLVLGLFFPRIHLHDVDAALIGESHDLISKAELAMHGNTATPSGSSAQPGLELFDMVRSFDMMRQQGAVHVIVGTNTGSGLTADMAVVGPRARPSPVPHKMVQGINLDALSGYGVSSSVFELLLEDAATRSTGFGGIYVHATGALVIDPLGALEAMAERTPTFNRVLLTQLDLPSTVSEGILFRSHVAEQLTGLRLMSGELQKLRDWLVGYEGKKVKDKARFGPAVKKQLKRSKRHGGPAALEQFFLRLGVQHMDWAMRLLAHVKKGPAQGDDERSDDPDDEAGSDDEEDEESAE